MVSQMRVPAAIFSLSLPFFVGCGFSTNAPIASPSSHVSGKIFGGQNPISSSIVSVWQVGSQDYGSTDESTPLATTMSASDGTFDIPAGTYTCPTPDTQLYITAAGGNATPDYSNSAIMLATGLGNCSSAQTQTVEINEVSTVVTAFALNWFYTYNLGGTGNYFGSPSADMGAFALSNAHTIPTLINLPDGTVNPNTSTITIEAAKIYSLANTLAACVNSTAATSSTACGNLFTYATDPDNGTPSDTLQAATVMATLPYQNVSELYDLGVPQAPFVGLGSAPNDWTIGVSYSTNTMGLGIAGTGASGTSSTIDIDTSGRVWVPSNAPGKTGVGYFDPSTTAFTGPITVTGVPLTQPQYLAIDTSGFVWVTDALSPNIEVVDSSGVALPVGGAMPGAATLGPVSIDDTGDAYLSYTDSSGNAYLGESTSHTTPTTTFTQLGQFTYAPTGLDLLAGGESNFVFASTSGKSTACLGEELDNPGSVPFTDHMDTSTAAITDPNYATSTCISGGAVIAQYAGDILASASSDNVICSVEIGCFYGTGGFISLPEGLATDGNGEEWIANAGNASLAPISAYGGTGVDYTAESTVPYLHGSTNGGTMSKPYGIAIDGSGNVWVSNASCVTTAAAVTCSPTALVLSELIGVAEPTITPLSNQDGGNLAGTEPESMETAARGRPMARTQRIASRRSAASHPALVYVVPGSNGHAVFLAQPSAPSVKLP